MRQFKTISRILPFFLTAFSLVLPAHGKTEVQKSCGSFVQYFYEWYTPRALTGNPGKALNLALKQRSNWFSPDLLHQLKQDCDAQAKAEGEIVGLDFDPILASQDPTEGYAVGKITRKGSRCWVEVHARFFGKRTEKPVVVPELMFKDGRWVFANFHYGKTENPAHENLLGLLKSLRADRQQKRSMMQPSRMVTSAADKPGAERHDSSSADLESQFEKASTVFLEAIVAGRLDLVLGLWSKDGVVQGIDGPNVSRREISTDFSEASGLFCLMFDTDCLRKQPGFERQYSYRDLLSKAPIKKVKRRVVRYPDGIMGELRVELHGGPIEEVPDRNPFEVDFVYENGEWKLAVLP